MGGIRLDLGRPAVMGILNVTPDSFWKGSRRFGDEEIAARVREIRDQGAAIIDIGGYSSRPGAENVSLREELRRVCLGVAAARREAPDMVVSIDVFRAGVAGEVIRRYGECMINDISAGELDPEMIGVAAKYGVPYIAMHMRGTPANMQTQTQYADTAGEVINYLFERAAFLKSRGVENVILDPGFGFAKTTEQNYELLARLEELTGGEYPVLAGVSRKSMIYKVLGTTPAESLAGTDALNWECLRQGVKILRVHDVVAASDIVKLYDYFTEHGKI